MASIFLSRSTIPNFAIVLDETSLSFSLSNDFRNSSFIVDRLDSWFSSSTIRRLFWVICSSDFLTASSFIRSTSAIRICRFSFSFF